MKNSKQLLEARGALVEELETILDTVATEERDFTEVENTRQDAIHREVAELDDAIKRAKNNEAVFAAAAGEAVSKSEAKEVEQIARRYSLGKAISDIANKGQLEGIELEMAQEARAELSATGASARGNLTIPSFLMGEARANETYTVGDTNGQNQGDNVRGTEHLGMIEGLRPVPVLERMGANVIQATSDLVLPSLPTADASKVDELGTLNNIDGDFSNVKLSPKRFGMRMDLTRQMLHQSDPQLDSIIARDMSVAIANEFDQFVIGTNLFGSSNITDGSVVDTDTCQATSYSDFTAHEGAFLSNNPAGQNLALLMDPTMSAYLKGVSQSAGGPILNQGNEILGYRVFTSTNVEQQHVDAKAYFSGITSATDDVDIRPIFFIDPSDLFIARFGGLDVTGDALTQAHTGTIRLIANMYADASIRRAGSVQVLGGLVADVDPAA